MSQKVGMRRPIRLGIRSALLGSMLTAALTCSMLPAGELIDRVKEAAPFGLFSPNAEKTETPSESAPSVVELASSTSTLTMQTTPDDLTVIDLPVVDGRDISCRAAQNWTPAQVLRARGRTVVQVYCDEDECSQQAARSLAIFLNMQANHQEDIGAASALRAYYTRIAIQEHLLLTVESLSLLDSEKGKQQAAQEGGLPAGTDLSDFERQRIAIEDQQLQLQSQERQLRKLLAQLARVDYAMDSVRQEALEVIDNSLNCERLKTIALATRHDIRGWAYLAGEINETSAPVYAKMLSTLVGGFGLPIPTISGLKNLLCPPDNSCLAANMRQELNLTVETHRRWICQAVDEKCAKVELAYRRIDLARQTVDSWKARLAQLEKLEDMGNAEPKEFAMARVGRMQARVEEISRRLDARIAEVDLAEAIGGLNCRCCNGLPWLLTGSE